MSVHLGVFITLGGELEAGIAQAPDPANPDELVIKVYEPYGEIQYHSLGPATEKKIDSVIDCLQRLKIHAVDPDNPS